jgi:hypothetical protein
MDLGRYQKGDYLGLVVHTVDGDGQAVEPDLSPMATIRDPGGDPVKVLPLPLVGREPGVFGMAFFLGLPFGSLGTYTVTYAWDYAEGAGQGTASDTFEVIAGGDEGGAVVSMCHIDRPEAGYVVAQLASGKLVQGRNPRLE